LVVEDEYLVGFLLCCDLQEEGYSTIGPFSTVEAAMAAVNDQTVDGAILDINLVGGSVYPVAEELIRREIPFLFVSGYSETDIPEQFRQCRRVSKPADTRSLMRAVSAMISAKPVW
jgi:DNA-binding response OmpR family regulator